MKNTTFQNVSHYKKIQDEYRGTNEKEWIQSPENKLYLFKKTQIKADGTTTNAHYAEILYYDIASLLGFPCAKPELAQKEKAKGIISEYFLNSSEELLDYQLLIQTIRPDFSPKSLKCKRTKEYYSLDLLFQATRSTVKEKESYRNIRQQIINVCYIDALCGHYDRNPSNIALIKDYSKFNYQRYRLAPIYDNGTSHAMSLPIEVAQKYLQEEGIQALQQAILSKIGIGTSRMTTYGVLLDYLQQNFAKESKMLIEKIGDLITTTSMNQIINQQKYRELDSVHKELAYLRLLDMKEKIMAMTMHTYSDPKIKTLSKKK